MIQVNNLSFAYRQHNVLGGVDINLEGGQVCGLLGLNGEGKTTLLYLLSGLLRPCSGSVMVCGYSPMESKPSFLSNLFLLTEDVAPTAVSLRRLAKKYASFYPNFSYDVFNKVVGHFKVDMECPLTNLSMGQAKKAHMCLAFACQTSVLLLDEPTNGLDIPSKIEWRRVVAECMTDDRIIIISSHQVRDIENMLDRVLILNEGRIVFNHSIGEITDRLSFNEVQSSGLRGDEIYSIPSAMGHKVVGRHSADDEETGVDIEMLFSAVLSNSYGVGEIFK